MPRDKGKLFYATNASEDGPKSVVDDERSGRPSTSKTLENVAKVREAVLADRRQNIRDVFEVVGLSQGPFNAFGGQFEHETHFCQICAKTAERRPGLSRFCLQGTQTSQR
jgi:hypothetical protein